MATAQAPKRLSQTTADQLSPTGAKVRLKDHKVSNLYLRMTPAGVKTYAIIYRDPLGAQREMALGSADRITLEMARVRAREELGKLSTGVSPIEQKREALAEARARKANTVAGLIQLYRASSLYREIKASTQAQYDQYLDTYVMDEYGDTPFTEVKRGDVAMWLDRLRYERSPSVSNSSRSALSRLMSFAVSRGLLEYNPVAGIERPKGDKKVKKRVLTDNELIRLWNAIGDRNRMGDTVADMLRLLMFIPPRRSEIANMVWEEVDFAAGHLIVPAERMKGNREHDLPLNKSALDLLSRRRKQAEEEAETSGAKVCKWVFPNRSGDGPMDGKRAKRVCDRLRDDWHREREQAEGRAIEKTLDQNFGPHAIRKTIATRLRAASAKRGFHPELVERLLSHAVDSGKAIESYDFYDYLEEKKELVDMWEAELLRIVEGRQPPENVVPLKAASAAK